jgi:hypothetical protein
MVVEPTGTDLGKRSLEGMIKIQDFYFKQRIAVLHSFSECLVIAADSTHPYHSVVHDYIHDLFSKYPPT